MTQEWFRTTGYLTYDPPRDGMKTRTVDWCVLNVDREITRYFRYWMDRNWWDLEGGRAMKRVFQRPSWDAHVTVVRGESYMKNRQFWRKHQGEKVTLEYSNIIHQTRSSEEFERPDHFWFVDIRCPRIWEIREELGLPNRTPAGKPYNWHLTVARAYDIDYKPNKYAPVEF